MLKNWFLSGIGALSFFFLLAGCGGSNQTPPQTPPQTPAAPQFTNTSLSGAYAFTVNGFSANALAVAGVNTPGLYSLTGTFVADGLGNISQGHTFYAVNTLSGVGPGSFGNQDFSGTYTVNVDGRGTANLSTQIVGPVVLDFVLVSAQHGELIRFDNDASPSGTLDKLNTSITVANLSGTWAFNVKGTDTNGKPKASVGVFTVDSSGLITSGIVDSNDNGTISTNVAMDLGPASEVFVTSGLGRGGVQFSTAVDPLRIYLATFLDPNHLRLQSGEFDILTGDAYRVSGNSISGPLAFTLAGTGANGAFATGGILNTDGAGNILNSSLRDTNDGGTVTLNAGLAGTYSITGNRATFSLNGGAINLVGYPSTGGIQLLDLDATTVASGVALTQSGTFSSSTLSGHYGATLAGTGNNHQFGLITELTANGSGQFTGTLNLNDGGSLARAVTLTGSYAFSPNGRATAVLTTASGTRNIILYAVDNSQALFIEADTAQIGQGVLARQN
jgi:hypothetical protein